MDLVIVWVDVDCLLCATEGYNALLLKKSFFLWASGLPATLAQQPKFAG